MDLFFQKTTSQNTDFQLLVNQLDAYLTGVNGDADDFFKQFNQIDLLQNVIVAYQNKEAVGCGAIKVFDEQSMEIKRMYVLPNKRGQGIAKGILSELENWAMTLGFEKCVLETSKTMLDALALYQKCGYEIIPNYGQYKDVETSVCFEKILITETKNLIL
jgi:putative acetyltransferase